MRQKGTAIPAGGGCYSRKKLTGRRICYQGRIRQDGRRAFIPKGQKGAVELTEKLRVRVLDLGDVIDEHLGGRIVVRSVADDGNVRERSCKGDFGSFGVDDEIELRHVLGYRSLSLVM